MGISMVRCTQKIVTVDNFYYITFCMWCFKIFGEDFMIEMCKLKVDNIPYSHYIIKLMHI